MKNAEEKDRAIAARLRGKLTEKKIQINSLVDVVGVAPNTLYRKMSGETGITIAELYLISMACLFTREDVNYIIFG